MSENTVRVALRRLGFDNDTMTPPGFRAMALTILVERLNVVPDVIEAQLAQGMSGPLGAAYDRAEFMAQRRQMMAIWADCLDESSAHAARNGAERADLSVNQIAGHDGHHRPERAGQDHFARTQALFALRHGAR